MNIEELLELLKQIYCQKADLVVSFLDKGHRESADAAYWESHGLEIAIKLMTNKDYYNAMKDIYLDKNVQ